MPSSNGLNGLDGSFVSIVLTNKNKIRDEGADRFEVSWGRRVRDSRRMRLAIEPRDGGMEGPSLHMWTTSRRVETIARLAGSAKMPKRFSTLRIESWPALSILVESA